MSKTSTCAQLKLAQTFRVADSFTDAAIFKFFQSLDSPVSLKCWLLYKHKEFAQLADVSVDPHQYNNADAFRDDYTASCFLSKANFLPLEVSKKDAALAKFLEYEELCSSTNNRFRLPLSDPLNNGSNVWLLSAVKRKIERILGRFNGEEFVDSANWGPGVTTLTKGEHVSAENKFQSETGITHDLYDFVAPWLFTAYPRWTQNLQRIGGLKFQPGNAIVTVPKNSKTDRVIAIEPGLNLWFQKGVGAMIRRRLLRVGIDLNSQVRNAVLAKQGSLDGSLTSLATVDFSSASDSISSAIVRELVPHEWLLVMDACRSKVGTLDDQVIRWQKFSSMGNGFTFELESLIFYAMALVVCEYNDRDSQEVSVFGDDVIIPRDCLDSFRRFSEFLGFRVNTRKSFGSSYFRESCGSHWFDGCDCKPIFLKERLSNVQTIYKLANSVRHLGHRRNSYYGCDRRFRHCWSYLFSGVPNSLRFRISAGFGETGFVSNFDEASPACAADRRGTRGFEGFFARCLIEVGVTQPFDELGLLLARISRGSQQERGNFYTLRGRTKLRISEVLVHQWYNLGSWT